MGRRRFGKGSGALFRGLSLAPAVPLTGATALLTGYDDGVALAADDGVVAVKDSGTPANDLDDVAWNDHLSNTTTSPKLCLQDDGTFSWSPHNLFLNSNAPVTQNVTLVVDETYTYSVTGTGSLAGTAGASGTATEGNPVTFVATTTTGTFTVTGSLTTIQINKGPTAQSHLLTAGAVVYGAGRDYDPVGAKWSLLSERSATNVCLNNQTLLGSVMTVTTTDTGPDGQADCPRATVDTDGNARYSSSSGGNIVVNTSSTYTVSGYFKSSTGWVCIRPTGFTTSGGYTHFDTTNMLVGTVGAGDSAAIRDCGNGWAHCSVTFPTDSVDTVGTIRIYMARGDNDRVVFAGDWFQCWNLQVEESSVATSPIRTFGSSVTRDQDEITWAPTVDSALAVQGSTFWRVKTGNLVNWMRVGMLDAGAITNSVDIRRTNTGVFNQQVIAGGVATGNTNSTTLVADTEYTVATRFDTNDFAISINGAAEVTDTSGATLAAAPTTVGFGCEGYDKSDTGNFRIYGMVYVSSVVADLTTWEPDA